MSISASLLARQLELLVPNETEDIDRIRIYDQRRISNLAQLYQIPLSDATKDAIQTVLQRIPKGSPGREMKISRDVFSPKKWAETQATHGNEDLFIKAAFSDDLKVMQIQFALGLTQEELNKALEKVVLSPNKRPVHIYQTLLGYGANPFSNGSDIYDRISIFELAVIYDSRATEVFILYGFTPNQHAFLSAALDGDFQKVKDLYTNKPRDKQEDIIRALSIAKNALNKLSEVFEMLCDQILLRPDVYTAALDLALIYAMMSGNIHLVDFLREKESFLNLEIAGALAMYASEHQYAQMLDNLYLFNLSGEDKVFLAEMGLKYAAVANKTETIKKLYSLIGDTSFDNFAPLNNAIAQNSVDAAKLLASYDEYAERGNSFGLHASVNYGYLELAKYFYDIGDRDVDGALQILFKTFEGYYDFDMFDDIEFDIFEYLYDLPERTVTLKQLLIGQDAETTLNKLIYDNNLRAAELLLKYIRFPPKELTRIFLSAITVRDIPFDILTALIKYGANPNGMGAFPEEDDEEYPPIITAIMNNDYDLLVFLYKNDARFDITVTDPATGEELTALQYAMNTGVHRLVRLVREALDPKPTHPYYRPTSDTSAIMFEPMEKGQKYCMCSVNPSHVWEWYDDPKMQTNECPYRDGPIDPKTNKRDPAKPLPVVYINDVPPTEFIRTDEVSALSGQTIAAGESYVMCDHDSKHVWEYDPLYKHWQCPHRDGAAKETVYINTRKRGAQSSSPGRKRLR